MKVSELLTGPEKWTKRVYARNASSVAVTPKSDEATGWCLVGAIRYCYPLGGTEVFDRVEKHMEANGALKRDGLRVGVSGWHDAPERTFEDVRQLITELGI